MLLQKVNIAMKKCVACQRKSSLYDRDAHFFVPKKKEVNRQCVCGKYESRQ